MNKYSKLSIRTIARFFYQFFKGYFFKKEKLKKKNIYTTLSALYARMHHFFELV